MLQSPMKKARRLGLASMAGLAICMGAVAQTDGATTLERQSDEAFRRLQAQPQDLGLWSMYAQLLVQAGNYEGGIAALERLLQDPQASPDLRVDIAALYYRLGSYAMAETMLDQALADPRLQGEKRAFALALKIDTHKRNQRSQLQGVALLGLRHQSNPAYRTDASSVLSAGTPVPLPDSQRPQSDSDVNLGLRLNHLYDLDKQNSASIVTNFNAYLVDYRNSKGSQLQAVPTGAYDLQVLDLNTGLQFKPMPAEHGGLTLRPFILLNNEVAQGHQYFYSQGLGVDAAWRTDERTLYELTLDSQDRRYAERIDVPNAKSLDGRLDTLRARASRELGAGKVLIGEYAMRRSHAGQAFLAYDSHELRATMLLSNASPIAGGGPWTTAIWLGGLQRQFDGPDPAVSSSETRKDRELRVGLSQTVPLAPKWSLVLVAEYFRNQANLSNYGFKNTTLSGTVIRSF